MEPWRYEEEGKWETVKAPKGKNGNKNTKEETKKGKKAINAPAAPAPPTGAGGVIDPAASAFTALDEWERRRAAQQGIAPPDDDDDDEDSDDGFSTVRRKKGKQQQQQQQQASGSGGGGAAAATDGAFGWANVSIPGQPMPKKPKQPRAPRPSVADCGAKMTAADLKAYLSNLEKEYPGMNHLVFFGDYFRKAFEKADAVALNKLVTTTPIAAAAEQPLCHVTPAVVAAATQWLAKRDFDDVSNYATAVVSQLGDPEPSAASAAAGGSGSGASGSGGGKSFKASSSAGAGGSGSGGGGGSGGGNNAPPARPTAGLLVTIALVLRAVPGALNPPSAAEKHIMHAKHGGGAKLAKPECVPMLAWVVAQACAGNAAAGLGLWSKTLLPMGLDAAAKRGAYGGKSSNGEREETSRLAAALAEHLTGTTAARRRLSGAAPAMSVDTGVAPSAVDLLLRARSTAPFALSNTLGFLEETCRAPNGAQRAAGVAVKMWPVAAAQATESAMTNAEDAARVRASGFDNLMWCVGAASPSSVRSFIPQLCDQHPEVGRDVLRRVADVLEAGVHTGHTGHSRPFTRGATFTFDSKGFRPTEI